MTTTASSAEQGTARRHRSGWLVLLASSVVIGVGAAITWVVVAGDDELASAAELSQVQASCGDWLHSLEGDSQADDQWCTDMFAWMSDQSGGSMMWQGPERMGETCREWVARDRAETGAAGPQQCNLMVDWMNVHMSSQGGQWMMQNN
jgi:hypothetical protein